MEHILHDAPASTRSLPDTSLPRFYFTEHTGAVHSL